MPQKPRNFGQVGDGVSRSVGLLCCLLPCLLLNPAFVLVRKNQYDGIEEFWVDVRTTGSAEYVEKNTERESNTRAEAGEVPCPIASPTALKLVTQSQSPTLL